MIEIIIIIIGIIILFMATGEIKENTNSELSEWEKQEAKWEELEKWK